MTTATFLDGKLLAQRVRDEVRLGVAAWTQAHGRAPGLDVVLVGNDPASAVYTRSKEKAALEVGIRGRLHRLAQDTSERELLDLLSRLNSDDSVDGILVQLPLPQAIREQVVLEAIHPAKDVDGFHPTNVGLLATGRGGLVPCTPRGCMKLIALSKIDLKGAHAVIVGRSNIVGKPLVQLLLAEHATVTIAHSRTRDLAALCRTADVLVAAVGKPKLLGRDAIKPGAVVIDVGINRTEAGTLVGDVDTDSVMSVAGFVTPVPGGVGPMTIACLLENTLTAASQRGVR